MSLGGQLQQTWNHAFSAWLYAEHLLLINCEQVSSKVRVEVTPSVQTATLESSTDEPQCTTGPRPEQTSV